MSKNNGKGKLLKIVASMIEPTVYRIPLVGHIVRLLRRTDELVEWQNIQEEILVDTLRNGESQDINCYCYGTRKRDILNAVIKNPQSLEEEWAMTYEEYVVYLINKYGSAQHDYFYTESCRDKNLKIERLNEGLFCHHMAEECHVTLKQMTETEYAESKPFDLYSASHFVYCNYFEHLLLHTKIAEEDVHVSNGMPVGIDLAEARKIWRELNRFYATGNVPIANKAAAELIKDRYDDYLEILKFVLIDDDLSKFCDIDDVAMDANGVVMQKIANDLSAKLKNGD